MTFMGKKLLKSQCGISYSWWSFFSYRSSWNWCFLLARLFLKLPFLTETPVEKITTSCMYPGYKQSSLFLLQLFCWWHFAISLCAACFGMSLCAALSVAFEFDAEVKQSWRRRLPAWGWALLQGQRTLGWAEPYSSLLNKWTLRGHFGFGKKKSPECVRVKVCKKVLGIWVSAR